MFALTLLKVPGNTPRNILRILTEQVFRILNWYALKHRNMYMSLIISCLSFSYL